MYEKKKRLNFFIRFCTGIIYILFILFSIEKGGKIFTFVMIILSYFCLLEFFILSKFSPFFIKKSFIFFVFFTLLDFFFKKKYCKFI